MTDLAGIVEDYLRCLVAGDVPTTAHGIDTDLSSQILGGLLVSALGWMMEDHPSVTPDEWVARLVPAAVEGIYLIESFTEAFPDS